jgi:very-short-patch-repair endonuclease
VVLEIDGAHHMDVAQWQADMRRERGIVISRRWVMRATALEVRLEPRVIVADLKAMGVPPVT